MGNIVNHIDSGGGASNSQSFSEASNGYSVGDVLQKISALTSKAQADVETNAESVLGIVETAGDPNFSVVTEGPATVTAHGLSLGKMVYLSQVSLGKITTAEPSTGVYKAIGFVKDANTIHVRIGDTVVIGEDSNYAFQHFALTGDGTSTNFDLPVDIAGTSQVLVEVNGKIQGPSNYTINGDGNGNPRRITFDEAPDLDVEINVHYLGIVKPVAEITPVSSTDYNSGTPVALASTPQTTLDNLDSASNFVFAHGLGVKPKEIQVILRCNTIDQNYAIGDEVSVNDVVVNGTTNAPFVTVASDTTNIELIFNRGAVSPLITDKISGTSSNFNLERWGVVVYANAEMGGTNGVISAVNTPATEFESLPISLSDTPGGQTLNLVKADSSFTQTHGLGVIPKSIDLVLKCNSTELGFDVGDEVDAKTLESNLGAGTTSSQVPSQLFTLWKSPTEIGVSITFRGASAYCNISRKDTGVDTAIDLSKWNLVIRANSELGGYKGDRGPAGTGKIAQVKFDEVVGSFTSTGNIPNDATIPQNNEGDLFAQVQITPTNPDSTLIIEGIVPTSNSTGGGNALFRDNESDAFFSNITSGGGNTFKKLILANGTSTRTYTWRVGAVSGSKDYNDDGGTGTHGGIITSTLTVTEILP